MTDPIEIMAEAIRAMSLHEREAIAVSRTALSALTEAGFAIVPVTPTVEMVAATVQQVGDPSPEAWAISEKVCAILGGPRMEGETACATLVRDWQGMIEAGSVKT